MGLPLGQTDGFSLRRDWRARSLLPVPAREDGPGRHDWQDLPNAYPSRIVVYTYQIGRQRRHSRCSVFTDARRREGLHAPPASRLQAHPPPDPRRTGRRGRRAGAGLNLDARGGRSGCGNAHPRRLHHAARGLRGDHPAVPGHRGRRGRRVRERPMPPPATRAAPWRPACRPTSWRFPCGRTSSGSSSPASSPRTGT